MTQTQQDRIINSLIDRQITISTMESCTSGMIASMITDTSGASAVFPGGFVTYLNETKVFAGVDEKIIKEYGVYSGECAKAMAETVREKLNTDIGIGITGTTGNLDPNNADSVQGQAFFSIVWKESVFVDEIHVDVTGKSRHGIKQLYADRVFEKLAEIINVKQG
ncbi:CinA family protein [Jutongia sp.]|jgi:nicotinamide-nucleotide amidase|uniref:CinA family protein n=1 Tax=Jutongia sp. TaxID=2944204 RepID=UPI000966FFA6|nr:MAG: damage-inducible protein CinA [Clostridium sp. 44_14]